MRGLNNEQVVISRNTYGDNRLAQKQRKTFLQEFLESFNDPTIKLILFTIGISVFISLLKQFGIIEGHPEWIELIGVVVTVIICTLVSTTTNFAQGNKAQKLKESSENIIVKAYRNDVLTNVLIHDIVVGDYILLQSGDKVPADGFLYDGNIKVDNSALNGESEENKKIGAGENFIPNNKVDFTDVHKVYRGAITLSGEGIMIVTNVGDMTEMGAIASSMNEEQLLSPLTVKLEALAGIISKFGYVGALLTGVIIATLSIINTNPTTIFDYLTIFTNSLTLGLAVVVMAVPEGLPLVIAVVLSQMGSKMVKDNVLVKRVLGIETAGSLNIVFSDKTGTITKGLLEVIEFFKYDKQENAVKSFNSFDEITDDVKNIFAVGAIKNNGAQFNERFLPIGGNATDRALLSFVGNYKVDSLSMIKLESFDSSKKYSSMELSDGYTYFKGAPEKLLYNCTDVNYEVVDNHILNLANRAIRVLCLTRAKGYFADGEIPSMELIGLVGIRDDVRPEAMDAVNDLHDAGIQVVMITGDRRETAVAIAREANIITSDNDIVLTHDELESMSDEEISNQLINIRVIARATPIDKLRLVKISQSRNLVTAMTGDGANDSPALNRADVGFAMGNGTEAAKDAGDIILLDDNFATISKAVLYGRTIYKNIQKFIQFQLAINISAVLSSIIFPLLGVGQPLTIVQYLWINLVMDTLGALAFANEPTLKKYMHDAPKQREESILPNNMRLNLILSGLGITALSIVFLKTDVVARLMNVPLDSIAHKSAYFSFFIFTALINGLFVRTDSTNIFKNIKQNNMFLAIFATIIAVQVVLVTVLGEYVGSVPLSLNQWFVTISCSLLYLPVKYAIMKFIQRSDR